MADQKVKFEKNVIEFMGWCANEVGKYESGVFDMDTCSECEDLGIASPIEQILYTALKAVARFNFIEPMEPEEIRGKMCVLGLDIKPQYRTGKYRVDFLISYGTWQASKRKIKAPQKPQGDNPEVLISEVIVECDSQQFHERTERERRYEKARDRYLQSNGYVVFRYTGSDIIANAMKIAGEIISFVTGLDEEDLLLDSNFE